MVTPRPVKCSCAPSRSQVGRTWRPCSKTAAYFSSCARARLTELGESPRYLLVPGRSHRGVVLAFGASDDNLTEPVVDFVTRAP